MGSTSDDKDPSGRIQRPSDRPRRKKPVAEAPETHVQQLGALAELMLGAAWADGHKVAVEIVAIAEQLKEFVETPHLPDHVSALMERFDPATFDPDAACQRLRFKDNAERLQVMSLIARIAGADKVLHPAEETYLRRVATAMGLDPRSISIKLA